MYEEVLCAIFLLIVSVCPENVEVEVKQGKILGTREETVFEGRVYYAFYGIPYARYSVGKLRFKDPKPLKQWKIPLDARTSFYGACAQPHIIHKHALFGYETCQNLNVYTPYHSKDGSKNLKPVVVWIHGYAFVSSMSHIHGPDFFIDNDIIFISLTHRIGVFGFLKIDHPDSSGNMGLKDIVIALKWIKRNIKYFGGNKKQITVMGNSSAGTFLSLLLMTKSRKFFSKMILQSGASFSPSIFQGDPVYEKSKLEHELSKISSQNLLKASTKDIITASQKIYNSKQMINMQRPLIPFSPTIEMNSKNPLITKHPEEFYKNIESLDFNMPILIGFNSQESISEIIPFIHNPKLLKSLASFFKYMVPFSDGCRFNYTSKVYNLVAKRIKEKYFVNGISEMAIEDFQKYTTDLLVYPIYKFIKTHLKAKNSKMYVYKFDYVGSLNTVKATSLAEIRSKVRGASNGDEICYLMKCEPAWQTYAKLANDSDNRDKKFIIDMTSMWVNFVKYGNPMPVSHAKNDSWLPMTMSSNNIFLISKVTKMIGTRKLNNMYEFWNKIYAKFYLPERCNDKVHDEL